jgi:hypothetical protein
MRYLILIYGNPASQHVWEALSEAQRAEALGSTYVQLNKDLDASGESVVHHALDDPELTKRVSVSNGQTMTTDGPYAEVKEHLAGFYLVECDSIERAVEHAARIPEAAFGKVEVRPIRDLSAYGM